MIINNDEPASRVADVFSAYAEFQSLADRLAMPETERQGLLGLSGESWRALSAGETSVSTVASSALRRRIAYVLPLLREVAAQYGTEETLKAANHRTVRLH